MAINMVIQDLITQKGDVGDARKVGPGQDAKTLVIKTGSVTPKEDGTAINIPETLSGAKAFWVAAPYQAALAAGENTVYEVRGMLDAAADRPDIANCLYYRVNAQSGLNVAGTSPVDSGSGNIQVQTSKNFAAGLTYTYKVFYWED